VRCHLRFLKKCEKIPKESLWDIAADPIVIVEVEVDEFAARVWATIPVTGTELEA
jgi:hypothetical protein